MAAPANEGGPGVRYQPDERPPWPLAAGLVLQYCILALGGVVEDFASREELGNETAGRHVHTSSVAIP